MSTPVELYDQANRLKDAGQLDEAIAKLLEALALDPDYALAHTGLAMFYQKQGKHLEAVEHAQRVCELEPNDAFSFSAFSVICQRAFAGTNDRQYIQIAEEAMARARMIEGH